MSFQKFIERLILTKFLKNDRILGHGGIFFCERNQRNLCGMSMAVCVVSGWDVVYFQALLKWFNALAWQRVLLKFEVAMVHEQSRSIREKWTQQ